MSKFTILILACLSVLSSTSHAETRIYKWPDYTKPIGAKLVGINDIHPTIVDLELPASIIENNEIVLIVSTSLSKMDYAQRVRFSVNGRSMPTLIPGPEFKIVLEKGLIKQGSNKLEFLASSEASKIDIYDLRIELKESVANGSKKPPTNDSEKLIYKWFDYTKPFTTRIKVLSDKPEIVQVDLPASIIGHDKAVLNISASSIVGFGVRVSLSVNDTEFPSLPIGPGARIVLPEGILKAGINTLSLSCSGYYSKSNDVAEIDIYELGFELPLAKPTVSQTSPPIAAKPIEATTPGTPEPLKISKPLVRVEPTGTKREELSQAEQDETAPKKEIMVPVAETDFGQRWAVVIGVSEYEDTRIPSLRYAARDAQSVYNWLVSPKGGGFAPSRVNLLIDRKATNENIKDALFTWLKQAIEEDLVVIYFAGHGSPESPDTLRNLYLLPHDTKYSNIAVTGFPMWDIETALKRFIKAKRVVIIADACHSAGVGQAFDMATRAGRGLQINPINSGLQNLTDLGEGICVISASRDKEYSREGREWGGGHGVFSYYLIEGLKGAADFDKNGSVTIGELTVFVSQQVRRATLNAQNPIVSGRFDPSLSISK